MAYDDPQQFEIRNPWWTLEGIEAIIQIHNLDFGLDFPRQLHDIPSYDWKTLSAIHNM